MTRRRFVERERRYRRRLLVAHVVSGLVNALLLVTLPTHEAFRDRPRVAQPGPLRVLPELDIVPRERDDSRKTAAPAVAPPADFIGVEVEIVEDPEPRRPERIPRPTPEPEPAPDPFQFSEYEDLEREVQTTGHPVLAQADIQILKLVRPRYPEEARIRNIEGNVEVLALVDTFGRVAHVYVVAPGLYPLLEAAAVESAEAWLFRPYLVRGEPEAFWVRIPFQFALTD
jgi:protein TonB